MTIIEALKSEEYAVVLKNQYTNKWLFWDKAGKKWLVNTKLFDHNYMELKTLIKTEDESEAVSELLKG